jgi:hypothetical protein
VKVIGHTLTFALLAGLVAGLLITGPIFESGDQITRRARRKLSKNSPNHDQSQEDYERAKRNHLRDQFPWQWPQNRR